MTLQSKLEHDKKKDMKTHDLTDGKKWFYFEKDWDFRN